VRTLSLIAGALAGLVLAICLAGFVGPPRPAPPPTQLISDAHGAVAEICIQYRQDFHPMVAEMLVDLLNGLADDMQVRVVVEAVGEFDFLRHDLVSRGVLRLGRLHPVVTGFPITPWARDRFGALTAGTTALLAVPQAASAMGGPRGNDARVPGVLAATLPGLSCLSLPFQFEGGDLLADEAHVFIAANALARNAPEDADDRAGLLRRMQASFGKPVVAIGRTPEDVPDHHICMYFTPLGNGVVAVADPELGRRLYSRAGHAREIDVEMDPARYRPFQTVARCLQQQGFRVVRIPLLLTATPRVFVSYNNVILERRAGVKRVYLPVYDIPALDQAATAVFTTQGWHVTPVRVGSLYRHTGSLRCQVGIMRREEVPISRGQ
jgi:hypothetical protein